MEGEIRDSFIFYRSFFESIGELPDAFRLAMYDAICRFALNHEEPDFGSGADAPFFRALWGVIRPVLDANWQRFLNGRRGGAPEGNKNARKNNQETTENQPENNQKQANKDKDKDKDVDEDKDEDRRSRKKVTNVTKENFGEAAERLYSLYPSSTWRGDRKCYIKSSKDKDKLVTLLKTHSEEMLAETIRRYAEEKQGRYLKDFSTFLNNLPDYSEPELALPLYDKKNQRKPQDA